MFILTGLWLLMGIISCTETTPTNLDTNQRVLSSHIDSAALDNQTLNSQDGLFHTLGISSAKMIIKDKYEMFTIQLQHNNQAVDLLIHTGSTATWLATQSTACKKKCDTLPALCWWQKSNIVVNPTSEGDVFKVDYEGGTGPDAEYVKGVGEFAVVTIPAAAASKTFTAEIGAATLAYFNARGVMQGVMGLAPNVQGTNSDQLPPILKPYADATPQEPEMFTVALSGITG
jgi:hypothetical protein